MAKSQTAPEQKEPWKLIFEAYVEHLDLIDESIKEYHDPDNSGSSTMRAIMDTMEEREGGKKVALELLGLVAYTVPKDEVAGILKLLRKEEKEIHKLDCKDEQLSQVIEIYSKLS